MKQSTRAHLTARLEAVEDRRHTARLTQPERVRDAGLALLTIEERKSLIALAETAPDHTLYPRALRGDTETELTADFARACRELLREHDA